MEGQSDAFIELILLLNFGLRTLPILEAVDVPGTEFRAP